MRRKDRSSISIEVNEEVKDVFAQLLKERSLTQTAVFKKLIAKIIEDTDNTLNFLFRKEK